MVADTIIVGGGIAGLTAASFLTKAGRNVMLFEKEHYFGGLVNTFSRKEFKFDGGLRSIENSGIVFPMLKELGIDINFVKSPVSIGIENKILRINGLDSIDDYQDFLIELFPQDSDAIKQIIHHIKKITSYMDILYGIDNPIFLDPIKDRDYFIKKIIPWLFKFIATIGKIEKLNTPVNKFLLKFTHNSELIDIISQHFFIDTPASFALSYFSLYNDYNYPLGGTGSLPDALVKYLNIHGADLKLRCSIISINPENKTVIDSDGNKYNYKNLIWACDLKSLYNLIDINNIKNSRLKNKISKRKRELQYCSGAESVFSVYLSVDLEPAYFDNISTGHFFYTPIKSGLSNANKPETFESKGDIKKYLKEYVKYNTFEVSIPCLRDPKLSPIGKTGLEISILFDYNLAKKIISDGWKSEFKSYMEELIIEQILSIYPKIKDTIINQFSSTPLTIERYTSNNQGAIVGWSFTNKYIPVIHNITKVAKSVKTPIPDIYKCGQWSYSPSGMPISILTGKLAANKVLKKLI